MEPNLEEILENNEFQPESQFILPAVQAFDLNNIPLSPSQLADHLKSLRDSGIESAVFQSINDLDLPMIVGKLPENVQYKWSAVLMEQLLTNDFDIDMIMKQEIETLKTGFKYVKSGFESQNRTIAQKRLTDVLVKYTAVVGEATCGQSNAVSAMSTSVISRVTLVDSAKFWRKVIANDKLSNTTIPEKLLPGQNQTILKGCSTHLLVSLAQHVSNQTALGNNFSQCKTFVLVFPAIRISSNLSRRVTTTFSNAKFLFADSKTKLRNEELVSCSQLVKDLEAKSKKISLTPIKTQPPVIFLKPYAYTDKRQIVPTLSKSQIQVQQQMIETNLAFQQSVAESKLQQAHALIKSKNNDDDESET